MKLQEITANKLRCIVQLKEEIKLAEANNWPIHAENCRKELEQTKYEAMHPSIVLENLNGVIKV